MDTNRREPPAPRGSMLVLTIVLTVALMVILVALDAPLSNDVAGSGTISFELAGSPERAAEIVTSWEATGEKTRAAFALGLDFLFAMFYAFAISGACLAIGRRLRKVGWRRLGAFGTPFAWFAIIAGFLDWSENAALAVVLIDRPASPWTEIALACATPKFVLIAVAILFVIAGGVVSLVGKTQARA